jgi:hypothetical protein
MRILNLFALNSAEEMKNGDWEYTEEFYTENETLAFDIASSKEFRNKYVDIRCYHDLKSDKLVTRKIIPILETANDLTEFETRLEREAALKKLTPREKQLLGLA